MKEAFGKWAPRVLPILFFAAAVYVLYRELHQYSLQTIADQLEDFSLEQIIASCVVTILCYVALAAYDALALHYIGYHLTFGRLMISSYLGYAFSNNLGWPIITGTSMRYRFYSKWKISAFNAAKVVAFTNVTSWTGLAFLGSFIFLYEPITLTGLGFFEGYTTLPLGFISLGLVLIFLTFLAFRKNAVSIGTWTFPIPSFQMGVGQIAASSIDWALAATVFYLLLPEGNTMDYIQILQVFLLAQMVGLISHVPGGLGIFEALVVRFLSEDISKPEIMGCLLVFRIVYYLFPLLLALFTLGIYEVFSGNQHHPAARRSTHKN